MASGSEHTTTASARAILANLQTCTLEERRLEWRTASARYRRAQRILPNGREYSRRLDRVSRIRQRVGLCMRSCGRYKQLMSFVTFFMSHPSYNIIVDFPPREAAASGKAPITTL